MRLPDIYLLRSKCKAVFPQSSHLRQPRKPAPSDIHSLWIRCFAASTINTGMEFQQLRQGSGPQPARSGVGNLPQLQTRRIYGEPGTFNLIDVALTQLLGFRIARSCNHFHGSIQAKICDGTTIFVILDIQPFGDKRI